MPFALLSPTVRKADQSLFSTLKSGLQDLHPDGVSIPLKKLLELCGGHRRAEEEALHHVNFPKRARFLEVFASLAKRPRILIMLSA